MWIFYEKEKNIDCMSTEKLLENAKCRDGKFAYVIERYVWICIIQIFYENKASHINSMNI